MKPSVTQALEREERYIVIKRKHLEEEQERGLRMMLGLNGIKLIDAVVVEADWPEYEPVWKMIEDRVAGRPASDTAGDALREGLWRTIDSAPQTGETILAICASAYTPTAFDTWWQDGWTHYSRPEDKWHGGVGKWFPTHWMPREAYIAALSQPSPDEGACRCDACGQANPVWFAPSPLWNLVVGGPDATDDPGGIVCPICFIEKAEAAGIMPSDGAWLLTNEAPSPGEGAHDKIATSICQTVAEIPDRSSPDDQPDMMLVTADELHTIVTCALENDAELNPVPSPDDSLGRLREALEPFAAVLDEYDPPDEDDATPATLVVGSVTDYSLDLGDFRAAREALALSNSKGSRGE
ncbi:MAG: hypothetical protein ABS88_00030 [Sphingopyxis sp. SCN 67-31]|nr:MAG: hypothetical protein ABS88_00030 [Sphingopyxis sp. SCN 67-31]